MPKLLPRSSMVESETKGWVRSLIRSEMSKRGLTFKDLAQLLTVEGLGENEGNLRSKVSRGEMSASLLLATLYVLQCSAVNIRELKLWGRPSVDPDNILVTIDTVLNRPLVHLVSRDDERGEYKLRIGDLNTVISMSLERRADLVTICRASHYLALVDDPNDYAYQPCFCFASTPAQALDRAVTSVVERYDMAVRSGYEASEGWLRTCPLS